MDDTDLTHLRRCVDLAAEALEAGDAPFGSVLVGADGTVLAEARNRAVTGDATRHPELELAQWAAAHLDRDARAGATVYTSGEHCPMCSAAHGWAGLGRIVYAGSVAQFRDWMAEMGAAPGPVRQLPVRDILRDAVVEGPAPQFADELRALHRRSRGHTAGD